MALPPSPTQQKIYSSFFKVSAMRLKFLRKLNSHNVWGGLIGVERRLDPMVAQISICLTVWGCFRFCELVSNRIWFQAAIAWHFEVLGCFHGLRSVYDRKIFRSLMSLLMLTLKSAKLVQKNKILIDMFIFSTRTIKLVCNKMFRSRCFGLSNGCPLEVNLVHNMQIYKIKNLAVDKVHLINNFGTVLHLPRKFSHICAQFRSRLSQIIALSEISVTEFLFLMF